MDIMPIVEITEAKEIAQSLQCSCFGPVMINHEYHLIPSKFWVKLKDISMNNTQSMV